MAAFSLSRYFMALFLLSLYFKVQADQDPRNVSFYFKNFGEDSNFDSHLALIGGAKVLNDTLSIQITSSSLGSFVVYKEPIKVVEEKTRKMVSFSMYFVFSISSKNGDGLAFVMIPNIGLPLNFLEIGSFGLFMERKIRFLGVEFDSLTNNVSVNVNNLEEIKVINNVSSINLMLNSGERLQCWIDYEASSKRLEVRLSKLVDIRPVEPLLSQPIDLSQMWKGGEYFIGISSLGGNSSQKCDIYSWSFSTRSVPRLMHSQPLDPEGFREKEEVVNVHKRSSDCGLKILGALILGTGCGALGASFVLFLWTIFGNRRPVVPQEFDMTSNDFEYKCASVGVDNAIEDGDK